MPPTFKKKTKKTKLLMPSQRHFSIFALGWVSRKATFFSAKDDVTNRRKHTPLYENEQIQIEIIQWRLLPLPNK